MTEEIFFENSKWYGRVERKVGLKTLTEKTSGTKKYKKNLQGLRMKLWETNKCRIMFGKVIINVSRKWKKSLY
jgi:hypothetical protein